MREWLINVRKQKGLSQQQVADAVFINRAYYSQLESGKRTPSRDVAERLALLGGFHSSAFYAESMDDPFHLALQNVPMVLAHCDKELKYTWIHNPHSDFVDSDILGKRDDELDSNAGIEQLIQLKQNVLLQNKSLKQQITFPLSTGSTTYWVFAEPLYDGNKEVRGVVTASIQISDITR